MIHNVPGNDELGELLAKLTEERLTESEAGRLREILGADAGARDIYSQYVQVHTLLQWVYTPSELTNLSEATVGAAEGSAAAVVALPAEPARKPRWSALWLPRAAAMLAAAAVLVAVVGFLASMMRPKPSVDENPAIAELSSESNARWAEGAGAAPGMELNAGRRLELLQGTADIHFRSGPKVVLQGPCLFEIVSAGTATLTVGRLTAMVPKEAAGFAIQTPAATIVDRGTEFGVNATPDGHLEVHVFKGLVEAELKEAAGTSKRKVELGANKAIYFDAGTGKVQYAAAEPARFANSPATELAELPIRQWYAVGPLGHPHLQERPEHWRVPPVGAKEVRDYNGLFRLFAYDAALYPMDPGGKGTVDLSASYQGPLTQNVAGEQLEAAWKKWSSTDDKDEYPALKDMVKGAGLAYFSTWIYVPEETSAEVMFKGYGVQPHARSRLGVNVAAWINGRPLRAYRIERENPMVMHPVDGQKITLKAGWNHLYCRHASAWEGIRNAPWLKLPKQIVSRAKVSADPPEEIGRKFKVDGTGGR